MNVANDSGVVDAVFTAMKYRTMREFRRGLPSTNSYPPDATMLDVMEDDHDLTKITHRTNSILRVRNSMWADVVTPRIVAEVLWGISDDQWVDIQMAQREATLNALKKMKKDKTPAY